MPNIEDMFNDPEPPDEDDPEFQEEMFELHKYLNNKPEDLVGETPEYRAKYAAWLESQKAI
jgi:hypothetical protein